MDIKPLHTKAHRLTDDERERQLQAWVASQLAAAPEFSDVQWKRFARAWGFQDAA